MKKKILVLILPLLLIVVTSAVFSGCKKSPCCKYVGLLRDDAIIVVIEGEFRYRHFTVDDFAEIKATEVIYVMPNPYIPPGGEIPPLLNPDFCPILKIILAEPSSQNVLDAIAIMENYDFINGAEPVYLCVCTEDLPTKGESK